MNAQQEKFVEVRVVTTAGVFPESGFDRHPANQPVKIVLKKAQSELKITDTTNWIAVVQGRRINPELSYSDNGIGPKVEIDWGPDHGAGGNA